LGKIEITYKPLERGTILEALPLLLEQDVNLLQKKQKKGFAAVYGRAVVGVLLYDVREKYLVVDRIAVSSQYQRFGVGTGMLEMLCKLAEGLHYQLVFSFEGEGNRDPFYRFVSSTGMFYIERQEGFVAVLREDALKALCRKYPQMAEKDTSFFALSSKMQEEFLEQAEKVYPEIVAEIRNNNEDYNRKLCCCSVAHGLVQAACFIKDHWAQMELKLLYSLPGRGVLAAKALLQSIANLDQENLVPLYVAPTGDAATKIIDGLCPSYHIEKYIYMAYYIGKSEAGR